MCFPYVMDKIGSFSGQHMVHKGNCPQRPRIDNTYTFYHINSKFYTDDQAMKAIQKSQSSIITIPCSKCMP